jgi:uncharacterized protein
MQDTLKVTKPMDISIVAEYIRNCSPESKFYLGSDSERYKRKGVWYADYTIVVVAHIDGRHGCKVFGEIQTARDYDQRKDRPSMRLMGEVYRVAELFGRLQDVLKDRYVEIHLDLNSKKVHASNLVVTEALGYIKGTCNIDAKLKPEAFSASFCADRLKEILQVPYCDSRPSSLTKVGV